MEKTDSLNCLSLITLFFLLVTSTTPVVGQTYDFGTFSGQSESRQFSDLLQEKKTLWKGRADYLQFETGLIDDKLLTVSATRRRLRASLGDALNLLRGNLEKRIPGKILLLDLHSLENRPSLALTSVTFLTGDRLKTIVYVIQIENGQLQLTPFHKSLWEMIRPVGDQMMSQQYDLKNVWTNGINYLRTQQSGYARGKSAKLPTGSRVMSLSKLSEERWVLINNKGNLLLTEGKRRLSTVQGDFGATPHILKPIQRNWRRANRNEPVRLAPERIDARDLVAVMENPSSPSGILGWFSRGNPPSSIKLFSTTGNQLRLTSTIGPFNQTVLDVEVPPANPDQLLWLRRLGRGEVVLEMLDLNDL